MTARNVWIKSFWYVSKTVPHLVPRARLNQTQSHEVIINKYHWHKANSICLSLYFLLYTLFYRNNWTTLHLRMNWSRAFGYAVRILKINIGKRENASAHVPQSVCEIASDKRNVYTFHKQSIRCLFWAECFQQKLAIREIKHFNRQRYC